MMWFFNSKIYVFWAFLRCYSPVRRVGAIFGKIGLAGIDTTLATTYAAIMAAFHRAFFALGKRLLSTLGKRSRSSRSAWRRLWLFYFCVAKPAGIGRAALDRLSVVFVLVLQCSLGEHFTLKAAAGVVVVAGAVLMSL